MKTVLIIGGILLLCNLQQLQARSFDDSSADARMERQYLVHMLTRIADPVLNALSKNELRKRMPVESSRSVFNSMSTHLEAFGRLLSGMAPWLELGPDETEEGRLRRKYTDLAVSCIHNATDPASPDFMNFTRGQQPVVDAAYLAMALLRAPHQLWDRLDGQTKVNVINALRSSRIITPAYTNWLMFSATIEAALMRFDHSGDRMRIEYAIRSHLLWYKGDGTYGDGAEYHWDYYNGFVIQPMLLEVLGVLAGEDSTQQKMYDLILRRAKRYASVQERLISPEGTYPPVGRSLAYRFGAFQLLSKIALMHELQKSVAPQQVRAALYTMIKRQAEAPGTFDKDGWLQIGLYGHQPTIGETYISTGSLYLCSEAFLVLGLPSSDPFWQGADKDWTAKKIWKGVDVPYDYAQD